MLLLFLDLGIPKEWFLIGIRNMFFLIVSGQIRLVCVPCFTSETIFFSEKLFGTFLQKKSLLPTETFAFRALLHLNIA